MDTHTALALLIVDSRPALAYRGRVCVRLRVLFVSSDLVTVHAVGGRCHGTAVPACGT